MYFKRFLQLFLIYVLAALVLPSFTYLLRSTNLALGSFDRVENQ